MPSSTSLLPASHMSPDRCAITDGRTTRTFAELEQRSRRVAEALRALRIGGDRRFAVLMRNRAEWAELILGNIMAGTEYVPLNWHLSAAEAAYVVVDSGTAFLIHDDENVDLATEIAAISGVRLVHIEREWDTLVALQPGDAPPANRIAGWVLQYTGGTTGRPKAVVRRNLREMPLGEAREFYVRWARELWRLPEGDHTHLTVCPLYHSAPPGFLLWSLMLGHRVVVRDRFDARQTLDVIEAERVSTIHLVPTQIVRMLRLTDAERARVDVSSLEHVIHGAAPCPRWAKEQLIDWFGLIVWEYFGSTEGTGPFVCDSLSFLERPGTVGQPPPHLRAVVLDEHGSPARPGHIGELWFHSDWGPPTYLNDAAKTRSAVRSDGLFTAGDFGWLDDEGYLFVADRRVDLIISGGVNIYPAEVEAAITEHPGVTDAAVVGRPDDEWGQSVHAVVQAVRTDAVNESELNEFVRQRLAAFKCPRTYQFVASLPRDEAGKLRRVDLRPRTQQPIGNT